MRNDITKFLFKLFLFLPLFGITVLFPTWILWASGELMSNKAILALQKDPSRPVMVGRAYTSFNYYKILATKERRPKVIVLGASRTGPYRSKFFTSFQNFYNAGNMIGILEHLTEFLQAIPNGSEPEIILLGLDQRYFHPGWRERSLINERKQDQGFTYRSPMETWGHSLNKVLEDYIKGKLTIRQILDKDKEFTKIGLVAITRRTGLLNDGSWFYGNIFTDPASYVAINKRIMEQIETNNVETGYGDTISEDAVLELEKFLTDCKARNIHVVAYLTSFPHEIYARMESMGTYKYMFDLPARLKPIFDTYGYSFFNFSDLAMTGAGDEETIDFHHASEKGLTRLVIKLAEKDKLLQKYVDVPYLKKRLNEADNPIFVFNYDEF